jgi:tryptophan halogenase
VRKQIQKVVVVGGGTSGWLSAIHLSRFWKPSRRPSDPPLEVVLIESPDVPTIGVGEGTTGLFTDFLRTFCDERDFLRESKASFKLGIRHRDWRTPGQEYLGPLNSDAYLEIPKQRPETFDYFRSAAVAEGEPVWRHVLNAELMLADASPYSRRAGRRQQQTAWDYAYHFDNRYVAPFLRSRAEGVERIEGTVTAVNRAPGSGLIESVTLEDGRTVEGDLFVDCTGFRRILIGELGAAWSSYAGHLPVNSALTFSIPREPGTPIPPYTLAQALSAGWLWQTPTQERTGSGYVYSDAHIEPSVAQAEVEAVLGHPIEPLDVIRFESGRLHAPWIGNCLAVGLSSSFFNDTATTEIYTQLVQLLIFATEYLGEQMDFGAQPIIDSYNARMGRLNDDFRTFVVAHYQGGRDDSEFWRSIPIEDGAHDLLALWRERMPRSTDIGEYFGSVSRTLWFYTLDGLGLLDPEVARAEMDYYGLWDAARQARAQQRDRSAAFLQHAIGNAEYLEDASVAPAPAAGPRTPPRPRKRSRAERRRGRSAR